MLLGISVILGAVFFKIKHNARTAFDLTDDDVGRQVEMVMPDSQFPHEGNTYYMCYDGETEEDFSFVRVIVPDNMITNWDNSIGAGIVFTGRVSRAGDDVREEVYDAVISFYERVAEHLDDFTVDDALREETRAQLCGYCIEVISISGIEPLAPRLITGAIGGILILCSFIILISAFTKKKTSNVAGVFVIFIAAFLVALGALLFDKIRSAASIKKEGGGIYSMTYYGDIRYDDLIETQIVSIDDFTEWIRKNEYYNIPFEYEGYEHGCSAFTGTSEEGDILFAFNYDQVETDTLIVYSDPSDGYAHYGTVSLTGLNIGTPGGYDPDSIEARALMLTAPYIINDGINEAGLGVTFLQLKTGETHQDNGNPDIHINLLPGMILTRCATVEEAIDLLRGLDVHSDKGVTSHFFICDTSGRAVVIEWPDNEMSVIEASACTNSVLTPGRHFEEGFVDDRLPTLTGTLDSSGGIMTPSDARDLLDSVSQEDYTEWSCVYNLNDFCFTIYLDEDYSTPYEFGQ